MEKYECDDCGHEWKEDLQDYIDRNYSCPECGSTNIFEHGED